MEGFTVHKVCDRLVVSLYPLPGFKTLGTCVARDKQGKTSGMIQVFYAGDFFIRRFDNVELEVVRKAVLKLAQNFAVKTKQGVATTRLNFSTALRKCIEVNIVKDLNHAVTVSLLPSVSNEVPGCNQTLQRNETDFGEDSSGDHANGRLSQSPRVESRADGGDKPPVEVRYRQA